MNKITYHPEGYRHEAVAKVKRMLTKIGKEEKENNVNSDFYVFEKLTGVEKNDADRVKYLIQKQLENIQSVVKKDLDRTSHFIDGKPNDDYEEYFYLKPMHRHFELVKKLDAVYQEIKNYPELEIKRFEYIFNATDAQEKFLEIYHYLKVNPFRGFNQDWYAVNENREKKYIVMMFFSAHDLEKATSILCEYF
jgi:hypothetical protein